MKRLLILWVFFICFLGVLSHAQANFVEGLEDIPLPEGVSQIENGNLSFGNEEIRLIEAYLTSNNPDFKRICRFYEETLPQMGWQIKKQTKGKIIFEREGETLELSQESPKPLVIRLTVKSKI